MILRPPSSYKIADKHSIVVIKSDKQFGQDTDTPNVPYFEGCIVRFLNLAFRLGAVPSEICSEPGSRFYYFRRPHLARLAICVLIQVGTLVPRLDNLWVLLNVPKKSHILYCNLLNIAIRVCGCLLLYNVYWRKLERVVGIVNALANLSFGKLTRISSADWKWSRGVVKHLVPLALIVVVIMSFIGLVFDFTSVTDAYDSIVASSYSFFLLPVTGINPLADALVALLFMAKTFLTTFCLLSLEFLLISLSISLNSACSGFAAYVRASSGPEADKVQAISPKVEYHGGDQVKEVLTMYSELCKISEQMNEVMGNSIMLYMLEFVMFFSAITSRIILRFGWSLFAFFLLNVGVTVVFLSFAAGANNQSKALLALLGARGDDVERVLSRTRLSVLLVQYAEEPVGLKGGSYFTITFQFIVNTVATISTYVIIMIQLNEPTARK